MDAFGNQTEKLGGGSQGKADRRNRLAACPVLIWCSRPMNYGDEAAHCEPSRLAMGRICVRAHTPTATILLVLTRDGDIRYS